MISETQEAVKQVFLKAARKNKAQLFFADVRFKALVKRQSKPEDPLQMEVLRDDKPYLTNLTPALTGIYQLKNSAGVLQTCELLQQQGFPITLQHIRRGFTQVKQLTGLRGRWEQLSANPLVIADTGHNEAGIREVLKQIKQTPHHKLFIVLGMVSDKDVSKILRMLPKTARYYYCKASVPRALDEKELMVQGKAIGLQGTSFPTVRKALEAARKKAGRKDLIFVGGSTFTVADALD